MWWVQTIAGTPPVAGLFYGAGRLVSTGDEAAMERACTRLNDKERGIMAVAWTLDIDTAGVCWLLTPTKTRVCYGDPAAMARLCIGLNRYYKGH